MKACLKVAIEIDAFHFSSSLTGGSKQGRWEGAAQIVEDMSQSGISSNAFIWNPVITTCGHALQWTHALTTLADIEDHTILYSNTFNAVINALSGLAWSKSVEHFNMMGALRSFTNNWLHFHHVLSREVSRVHPLGSNAGHHSQSKLLDAQTHNDTNHSQTHSLAFAPRSKHLLLAQHTYCATSRTCSMYYDPVRCTVCTSS